MGRLCRWAAAAMLLAATIVPTAAGQTAGLINREYAVKAAFLYNFLSYIEWPERAFDSDNDPFVIGVYRQDPFGRLLDSLARKTPVGSRRIEVRRLDSINSLPDCHIVFIPDSIPDNTEDEVIRAAQGTHILTVGESDDFVYRGGAVQFFLEGNRVRFAFNTEVIDRGGLRVSSKLLSLAKVVPSQ